jgi:hypothetical protein
MYQKLKSYLADDLVFYSLLIVLVAIVAFLLGRSSVSGLTTPEASTDFLAPSIQALPALPLPATAVVALPTSTTAVAAVVSGPYVASKSGTKYHLVTCSGAKNIKEANKLFFATAQEAEAAGYTKAANCPGL